MPQFLKDREIAYEGLTSMTIVETMARAQDCHVREIAYEGLTSMTIVETMAERKTAMLEQGEYLSPFQEVLESLKKSQKLLLLLVWVSWTNPVFSLISTAITMP